MSNLTNAALILSLGLFTLSSPSLADIEGGSSNALSEHADLAQSIVKFESGVMLSLQTCTATVIAKNTFLTAQHCVEGLKVGDRVTLNGLPIYQIIALQAQDSTTRANIRILDNKSVPFKSKLELLNTDIGVFKVSTIDSEKSAVENLPPIPIASLGAHAPLSPRVLIAGYGISGPSKSDPGILRAGYTRLDSQDFTETSIAPKDADFDLMMARAAMPLHALSSIEKRKSELLFKNTAGSYLTSLSIRVSLEGDDGNHSQIQHGDSGGPLIAFDNKGKAFIVGVNSMGVPSVRPHLPKLIARDANGAILVETSIHLELAKKESEASENQIIADSIKIITDALEEKRFLSHAWKVQRDFTVSYQLERDSLSQFSSLQFSENLDFLKRALPLLK